MCTNLKEPGHVSQRAWNRRFRDEKLRASSINEVAEVLRDWLYRPERAIMQRKANATKRQWSCKEEICAAQGKQLTDIEHEIKDCLVHKQLAKLNQI